MALLNEYKIANSMVDEKCPELMTDEQKYVLKKLLIKELENTEFTFDTLFDAYDELLHGDYDIPPRLFRSFRIKYRILLMLRHVKV